MKTVAQGQFTATDVWQGLVLISRKLLVRFTITGLVILIGAIVYGGSDGANTTTRPILIIVGIFFLVWLWLILFVQSRRMVKTVPNMKGPIRYEFDDAGVLIVALHASTEMQWASILQWKENKNVFLLYQSPQLAQIIPKRFFGNEQDVMAVRELLRTNISKKK
jgi:hypothetical protein